MAPSMHATIGSAPYLVLTYIEQHVHICSLDLLNRDLKIFHGQGRFIWHRVEVVQASKYGGARQLQSKGQVTSF